MEIHINTKVTPFSVSLYYPKGPEILAYNFGIMNILGQDSVSASVTVTPDMEIVVKTDIYNTVVSLQGPHKDHQHLMCAKITYTEENKKLLDFTVHKEGSAYKANLLSSFSTVCRDNQALFHQWSINLNLELDLANKIIYGIVPAHVFSLAITKDMKTLVEVQHQHNMNQLPYSFSLNCPSLLAKPLVIKAVQETVNTVVIKVGDYDHPYDVEITTVGTVSTLSFGGISLVHLDVDFTNKRISYTLSVFVTPVVTVKWAVSDSIMKTNLNYDIDSAYTCSLKAVVSGELPVLGGYLCKNDFSYFITGKTGKLNYQGSAQLTSGPLATVPPTTCSVTTSYNLATHHLHSVVMTTVSDKTVGVKFVDNKIEFVC